MKQIIELSQKRILGLLSDAGYSQAKIAKVLGINQSAVSNMLNNTRAMKLTEAAKLIELLPGQVAAIREVPLIGIAGAGDWVEAIEHASTTVPVPADLDGDPRFAVKITGDSMNLAGLPDGSEAIVDPDQTKLFVGKLYLLINDDGEATIKRYRADPARFEPVSDNPAHQPFELGVVNFRVIGRVIGAHQRY